MPKDFTDFVAEVKSAADIVTIISKYVPLKKSGSRFLGTCPFHNDHSPSMNVTPQMGIYKCFVCGNGGDVFKFLQEYDKLSFIDALKLVADEVGLKMPENFSGEKNDWKKDKSAMIMEANTFAADFYHANLQKSPEVKKYLSVRGISEEVQKFFQVGLAPGSWNGLLNQAKRKGINEKALLEAGLIVEKNPQKKYDRFVNRLMFPIWNMSNRIIAFGGRTLEKKGKPKYLNSHESVLYNKSRILYGFNFARSGLSEKDEIILVEGYMDVLAMKQAGFDNVCAVSGTALTDKHAEQLSKFVKMVYLFFDGDAAGQKAAYRSLPVLLKYGIEIKIPSLPSDEDPDSYALKNGKEKTSTLLARSRNIVEFLTSAYTKSRSAFSPEQKSHLLNDAVSILNNIQSSFVKSEYIKQLNEIFGIQTALEAGSPAKIKPATVSSEPAYQQQLKAAPETQLLTLLLSSGDLCREALALLDLEWVENALVKDIISRVLAFYQLEGGLNLPLFIDELPQKQRSFIESIEILDFVDFSLIKRQFLDIVSSQEIRYIQRSMREINKGIRDGLINHSLGIKKLQDFQHRLKVLNTRSA